MAMPRDIHDFHFTPQMLRTLRWIHAYVQREGRHPNGEDVADGLEMEPSNASRHLRGMVERGLLVRRAATSRRNRLMWRYSVSAEGKTWL